MAGAYNGTFHEKNVNNMQEYYEVSKKNRYRKCMVTIDDKRKRRKQNDDRKAEKAALFHGWVQIKQAVGPSIMLGGDSGGEVAATLGIVEYLDGTVEQVYPAYIRFVDTKDYTGDWEG